MARKAQKWFIDDREATKAEVNKHVADLLKTYTHLEIHGFVGREDQPQVHFLTKN